MKVYCHAPWVPDELPGLLDLAYDLWWSQDSEAPAFFAALGGDLWDAVHHNPVRLLRHLQKGSLQSAARNADLRQVLGRILMRRKKMLEAGGANGIRPIRAGLDELGVELHPLAAYFSAEFGLHESLPIYSGGLGVLAGDHIRSTNDLAVPFCGISLLYRQGYFRQRFNLEGWQFELYEDMGFHDLPLRQVMKDDGEPLTVVLKLPGRDLAAHIWLAQIGRSSLYLLDSYLPANWPDDRKITNRLYDPDREIRLKQEILLGVGGVRLLEALHVTPRRYHMNEGHSAFLTLERAAQVIRAKGVSFEEAREITKSSNVFTTHTPVAAGHEVFRRELMEPYFKDQIPKLGLGADDFFRLGHRIGTPENGEFEMTSLAIRFSSHVNGVSRLHGEVSRRQWNCMWPELPEREVPIGHVTNGIHVATWIGPEMRALFDLRLGSDWLERVVDPRLWDRVDQISDDDLWEVRCRQRGRLVEAVRRHADDQLVGRNVDLDWLRESVSRFSPEALTIGFARRFATYKRATLLFSHRERLARLFADAERPVQVIFAGKSHPADDGGKRFLQEVIQLSKEEPFRGRVVFLEDYDMGIARLLVQGADVWLNNPRPPKEASGTSGMKACPNGGLTLSTRDGWWVEGANGRNGWTIGDGRWEGRSDDEIDRADAIDLLQILENEVLPLWRGRDARGLPTRWLERVRESIKTISPVFNTSRMVREYADRYYLR